MVVMGVAEGMRQSNSQGNGKGGFFCKKSGENIK